MFIDDQRQLDAVDIAALRVEATRWHLADDVDDRIHGLIDRFEGGLEVATDAVPQAPGPWLTASVPERSASVWGRRPGAEPSAIQGEIRLDFPPGREHQGDSGVAYLVGL